jgi:hypothetical protein
MVVRTHRSSLDSGRDVLGDVAHASQKGTNEREPGDPIRLSRGEGLAEVGAGRMSHEEDRFLTDDFVDEAEQDREHVIGAPQSHGRRRPAHARQVGIEAPKSAMRIEGRLEAGLGLTMVDTGAVQNDHGHATAALDVVNHDVGDPAFHSGTLASQ